MLLGPRHRAERSRQSTAPLALLEDPSPRQHLAPRRLLRRAVRGIQTCAREVVNGMVQDAVHAPGGGPSPALACLSITSGRLQGPIGRTAAADGKGRPTNEAFLIASVSEKEHTYDNIPLWKRTCVNLAAGAAAGVAVETVLYPVDTIKTRLQMVTAGQKVSWKGLYSGLRGNLVGVVPASAIFLGTYEPVKCFLLNALPDNYSSVAHVTAAALGGTTASLVRVPTEVVKQRMQMGKFATARGAVSGIVAAEGMIGLYAGYRALLARDLPFDAIEFVGYEEMKIGLKNVMGRDLKASEVSMVGAAAGALTGACTTPLDVIKTRLMVEGTKGRYRGVLHCTKTMIAEEGMVSLFKGWQPRVIWIALGGSVFFSALEHSRDFLMGVALKSEQTKRNE